MLVTDSQLDVAKEEFKEKKASLLSRILLSFTNDVKKESDTGTNQLEEDVVYRIC